MSTKTGELITCDRCGKIAFRKKLGEEQTDGGYTTYNKYEDAPPGWELCGNMFPSGHVDLCPACSKELNQLLEKYMRKPPRVAQTEEVYETDL